MRPLGVSSILIIIAGLGGYWIVQATQHRSNHPTLQADPFVTSLTVGEDCPPLQLRDASGNHLTLNQLAKSSGVLLVLATHGCGGCDALLDHIRAVLIHRLSSHNIKLVLAYSPTTTGRYEARIDSLKSAGIDCVTIDLPERRKFGLRVSPTLLGIRESKLVYLQIGYHDTIEESINALFGSANQSFFNYPY